MTVSVFITSYNQKDLLREAIDSVLAQTRMPDEIVIADDKSTDGSRQLIQDYAAAHPNLIRPLLQDRNVGIPLNKNAAYRSCSSDWVISLDGDDRFLSNKIQVDLQTLANNPNATILCSNFYFIDIEGNRTGVWCNNEADVPTGSVAVDTLALSFPRYVTFRNAMVQRELLSNVNFMDTQFAMYHDWELRIRLAQNGLLKYTHELTSEYRRHSSGISYSNPGRHFEECNRVYTKHAAFIETLPPDEKARVNARLRPYIGDHAWKAFRNAVNRNDRASAWRYFLNGMTYAPTKMNLRNMAKLALPSGIVRNIRFLKGE